MATTQQKRSRSDTKSTLPLDRSVPFCTSLYPRDPDAYEPLDHFYQRQKDPERYLLKRIDGRSAVRTAILEGSLEDNGDGCGVFILDHHGIEYYIVVGFHYEGFRVAVTAWPHCRDEQRARDSGAWSSKEIETIQAFNDAHFAR